MTLRDLVILGTSSQQPTRRRNHGAYLFRWNEEGLLFDPGEGTQRQFIFADVAPPMVTRIFVSHFHGDHCLGLGSMLMRLNLDKVSHPIHCYYPASGKKYFDRLRYGTIYHDTVQVVEHPITEQGIVHTDDTFTIEAFYLNHGVENLAWRVTETDRRRYDKAKLKSFGVEGPLVRQLEASKELVIQGKKVRLEDVSSIQKGGSIAYVSDTRLCPAAITAAQGAKLLLCESTYLEDHSDLATKHFHLTAKQAAHIAKEAGVEKLILTHFSARYLDARAFEEEARTVFPNTEAAEDLRIFPIPR